MIKQVSHSLEETAQIAHEWLRGISENKNRMDSRPGTNLLIRLRGNDTDTATIIGLSGHLGAGKTAFTKCVAKDLGITEDVTSPTFVIMKIYDIDPTKVVADLTENGAANFPWKRLVHIDAYRLERAQELEAINFAKYAADPDNLILIEWPENVKGAVEKLEGYSQINFSVGEGENERVVEY
ncbi:MAG: tRNA (adenosine(37)-N6)-threonylcarbamoyltransferase complex ATPase subunit type 1 TsaE [Candidatus Pacebacteria bacterium]|nr:tRNA (adenosine(37)-N6)-threonylcarbamoyltransferase complex ATPase subunit type 1 TsaE [Candidatus Paceibacterota bacterium]